MAQEADLELVERKPLVEHTLKAAMGTMVLTVDLDLVVLQTLGLTFSRLEQVAQKVGEEHVALDYLEMFEVGVIDAALAAQNAVSAAESLGLGTVYIGAMRNRPEEVAAELQLPPRVVAVFGLCVGTPDPTQPAAVKPRPPQSVVLHNETYSLPAQAAGLETYDTVMSDFYASQGMKVRGTWSNHSAKRVRDTAALSGRDRLVEALHQRGFKLK